MEKAGVIPRPFVLASYPPSTLIHFDIAPFCQFCRTTGAKVDNYSLAYNLYMFPSIRQATTCFAVLVMVGC